MNKSWYSKKTFVLFVFLILSLIFLFAARNIEFGNTENNKYAVFSVRFEYYGMDAQNIERQITIPLEEKISGMTNLLELRSTVEYGKSITTAYFDKKINNKNVYLELRNYVDTLYSELPAAVQKPRIYTADSAQKSVISFSINSNAKLNLLREYADTVLKNKFENIDGVAEVLVTGGTLDEILVEFDKEKIVRTQIDPLSFNSLIQDANVVSSGSTIKNKNINQTIQFDTKLTDINDVKKIPVKMGEEYTTLEYLANIHMHERDNEEVVRINGEPVICVQIISSYLGNDIKISKQVKKILKESELKSEDYQILQDNGQHTYELIKNVLIALLESFICVILLVPLFFASYKITLLLIIIIPVNILWTLSELNIAGFVIDQNVLSGITIAIGLIADSTLVIAEISEKNNIFEVFEKKIKQIIPSVISSSLTTVLALIPLIFMESIVSGIKTVAIAIILMLINSTIISVLFIPSFIYSKNIHKSKVSTKVTKMLSRNTFRILIQTQKNAKVYRICYFIILVAPFILFWLLGKNISLQENQNIIFASVEYPPEKDMKSIDLEVNKIVPPLQNLAGVNYVYSESRKGTCELEIGYDEKTISRYDLAEKVTELGKFLSEGYLYVPEAGQKSDKNNHQVEICVIGDDSETCKEYIKQIIQESNKDLAVLQGVMNFKDAEDEIIVRPDTEVISKSGITVSQIGSQLRMFLFGPVVDKWLQKDREIDVRIIGENAQKNNLTDLESMHITLKNDHSNLKNLSSIVMQKSTGKIYRINNRRCAFGTISIKASSSEDAIKITKKILNQIPFQKGYGYQLSRELENMKSQYISLAMVFILCVIGILILLTALTENFIKSLVIVSIIPVSIALPLIYKCIFNISLELGDVVGMILISGISVNNTIYIMESNKTRIIFRVQDKIKSILITSLTTIFGALPLVIMNTGSFAGTLSSFMMMGVLGSLLSSVILFPLEEYLKIIEKK